MKDGFIKVAAGTPKVQVADCKANEKVILEKIEEMAANGAKIIVLPELCLTSYDCRDLFWQEKLLKEAKEALLRIAEATKDRDALIFIGLPLEKDQKLYNVAAALNRGQILGIVPKTYLPNYNEFYEARYFTAGSPEISEIVMGAQKVPFGTSLIFACRDMPHLKVSAEICEDLWVASPPSISHAQAGATVIVNLTASDEMVGKGAYRRQLVRSHSASCLCGYIYAAAGEGESSTDLVFDGHSMIAENGSLLAESRRFENETIYADLDVDRLTAERRRMTTFGVENRAGYVEIPFSLNKEETALTRHFDPHPFVPSGKADRDERCEEILHIQAMGLKKRLEHTHCRHAVIGISGGLDSTLALLVTVKAFDSLNLPHSGIHAVTMPSFGTTDRTYTNACEMIRCVGADFKEVRIGEAVLQHFEAIGHDPDVHDVTYENSQARERTQVLMDLSNQVGGLVIGTGDLSELALGWATYNGDHMSMYAVNSSVPKTLVRHLVRYYAETCGDEKLSAVLLDVLDTPVSPELLPPDPEGKISQKTEDLIGPYELHDFYLYYVLRWGFEPSKIFRLALESFKGDYDRETILKWLRNFYRRFFTQQFKRSCLPDGPKVGSVAVSPRGDLRMPSDACSAMWLKEAEELS